MITTRRKASSSIRQSRSNQVKTDVTLREYQYPSDAEVDESRQDYQSHISLDSVADLENIVYMYLTELGKTPKLYATDEKMVGCQIQQGAYLSHLEQELNAKNDHLPASNEVLSCLVARFGKLGKV